VAAVLIINFALTLFVGIRYGASTEKTALMIGQCSQVRNLNVIVHLFINVVSTLLLSACNYCMQCLSAPNRYEIDKAHRSGLTLDLGVPSIRNLFLIRGRKAFMWCIFLLASVPLHML